MKQAGLLLGLICSNFLIECSGDDGKCAAFIGGGCLTWDQWGDKCYKVTEKLPWDEAKLECIKMGGVLVVPQLDGETDFLLKLYNQGFWIGCNQHNNPGLMIIIIIIILIMEVTKWFLLEAWNMEASSKKRM